ncbi:MAG: acyltransferase [Alphaproteobacteria bacterium]|nr:acyltransferase [Alphaproteobacteria bacterium]
MTRHSFSTLDGLRGFAAIAVLLYHFSIFSKVPRLFDSGFLAVDFFFVLSGFVLAHAYERRFQAGMGVGQFAVVRIIRLYPLYALATLADGAFFVGLAIVHEGYHNEGAVNLVHTIALSLLFIPSPSFLLPQALYPLDGPAWSIRFEMIANLLYRCCFRIATTRVLIAAVCIAFFGLSVALGIYGSLAGVGPIWATFFPGLLRVGFSFFAGVITYRFWCRSALRPRVPVLFLILLALGVFLVPDGRAFTPIFDGAACILFPVIVYLGACNETTGRARDFLLTLGDASYAIYIIQMPFFEIGQHVIGHVLHGGVSDAFRWSSFLLSAGVAWLAVLAHRYFDVPVRTFLSRNVLAHVAHNSAGVRVSSHVTVRSDEQ